MRHVSLHTLWDSIKDLFSSIYQTLLEDQAKMDKLKEQHRKQQIAEMDQDPEWTQSRGKEGQSWHVPNDDEDILGI